MDFRSFAGTTEGSWCLFEGVIYYFGAASDVLAHHEYLLYCYFAIKPGRAIEK